MGFTQAQIEIENVQAVEELKTLIRNALNERNLDSFLHTMKRFGYKVRQFDGVLEDHILQQVPGASASKSGEDLYAELGASNQGLIREFYLTEIERIPVEWRRKYQKLFQYA